MTEHALGYIDDAWRLTLPDLPHPYSPALEKALLPEVKAIVASVRGDGYVAVEDEAGSLIGFFQFKRPHGPRLEIGLGLHPEWTGQGLGKNVSIRL